MKATLEFNMPEESEEHEVALHGGAWKDVVWDLAQWLRSEHKYTDKATLPIDEVRKKLYEIVEDHDMRLD